MDYAGTINALLRAIGFKTVHLTQRLLQEKGASEVDTYTIYRYAFIPAVVWSLIFVRVEDINFVLNNPKLLIIFLVIMVLWNVQALIMSVVINSTSSMVLFTTLFNLLILPLYLGFGTFFNGDIPNIFSISAIVVLIIAFLIKPTPHKENLRPRLSKPFYVIALLIFLKACCDSVIDGLTREALQDIHPTVLLGIFGVITLGVCWMISATYFKHRFKETKVIKEKQWLALIIPMLWFAASIPETFALAAIPIYTVISISAVTFGMDTFSDIIHKRIRFNFQTFSFIALVLAGLGLSVLSV